MTWTRPAYRSSRVPVLLEDGENAPPDLLRWVIRQLCEHLEHLAQEIEKCEAMPGSIAMADSLQPPWGWFRSSILPAEGA